MIRVVGFALFAAFVTWGVARVPGRPFSWTMFTGSSKPFLWVGDAGASRAAGTEELGLAPDAHYLLPGDLETLVDGNTVAPFEGLILGTRGSWSVAYSPSVGLTKTTLPPDDDLRALAEALRRHEWT